MHIKKLHIGLLLAALMISTVLSSCASTPTDVQNSTSESVSVPESLPNPSTSISPTSSSSASTGTVEEREDGYIPYAPTPAAQNTEPTANRTILETAPLFSNLSRFNGLDYSIVEHGLYSHVQSALYSENDMFFLLGRKLYYCDSVNIYFLMDNITSIVGSDIDGIYLTAEDVDTPFLGDATLFGDAKEARLIHFDPVTGQIEHVQSNVQNGIVVGANHDILFYIEAEAFENELGYRYVIKRRGLSSGVDKVVFADDCDINFHRGALPPAAYAIEFNYWGEDIHVFMGYTFPSEYPYERHLVIDVEGNILTDSEKTEVIVRDEGYITTGVYQNRYLYHASPDFTQIGNYRIRLTQNNPTYDWHYDYSIMQSGEDLYWFTDASLDIFVREDFLYSFPQMTTVNNYNQISVYDGEYVWPVDFWERAVDRILTCGSDIYYAVLSKGENDTGMKDADWLAVYRAVGTSENPAAIEFIFAFEKARNDSWDDFYTSYGYSTYVVGSFLVLCTADLESCVVLNSRVDSVATMGTSDVTLWYP